MTVLFHDDYCFRYGCRRKNLEADLKVRERLLESIRARPDPRTRAPSIQQALDTLAMRMEAKGGLRAAIEAPLYSQLMLWLNRLIL